MSYKESYKNMPDGNFELIPAGLWPVQVINAGIEDSKSTPGNKVWKIELEITGTQYAGRKLWHYITMGEKAKSMRKGAMTAFGLDTNSEIEWDLVNDIINCKALAEVFHDEWQGQKREKVRRLRSIKPDIAAVPDTSQDEYGGSELLGGEGDTSVPF